MVTQMASTNSINTSKVRTGNMHLKTRLLGLIAITAAFGFVSTPARSQNAASVDQSSGQYTTQIGNGNSSINASEQTGIVSQKQPAFGSGINGASVGQVNYQGALQAGYGNSSVNANKQTGTILQGQSYPYYPHGGGINAADLTQRSGQAVQQLGVGNSGVNASEQSSVLHQHP